VNKALRTVDSIKSLVLENEVRARFEDMLKDRAPQFMASIINVVANSTSLQNCEAPSIMSAAFIAASFNLPIDSNLGFAAIVPYGTKAQFQIMWRGLVQLAVRSGQYKKMNTAEVYSDELKSYNPITGEIEFYPKHIDMTCRKEGKIDQIAGYYAYFELINGFSHELYMSTEQVLNHALTYSKAYQADIKYKTKKSLWSTNFPVMGKKTVLKLLIGRWGILSIDMQRALEADQKVSYPSGDEYADNPKNDSIVEDKEFEDKMRNGEAMDMVEINYYTLILEELDKAGINPKSFWEYLKISDPESLSQKDHRAILEKINVHIENYYTK